VSKIPTEFIVVQEPPRGLDHVRLAVPDAAVPAVAGARAWLKRRRGGLELARREMDYLLSEVADADEIALAARRFVRRDALRSELRWHPKLICHQPVRGVEHLRAARAAGRGVVLSFLHHGHYEGAVASISAAEEPIYIALSPDMFGPEAPAFLRQHVRTGSTTGGIGVNAAGGAAVLAQVLLEGNVLAIATDVPGRTPVNFLGKERLGSSGAARLAAGTNSLVVIMTAHCDADGRLSLELSEPLEPGDFAGPDELVTHLLQAQEPAIRAWPEGYHHPTMRWGVPATS